MALRFSSTAEVRADALKLLVHGYSDAGKTRLCSTLPHGETLIISAEAGLLSLRDVNIATIEIETVDDVAEAFRFVTEAEEAKHFNWIALDSITEIAERVLVAEKKVASDPRQAYGALIDHMGDLVKSFRDIPDRNVYMSCKQEQIRDDATGSMKYGPSMPGSKLGPGLPFLFDEVFALRVHTDNEGITTRILQTRSDAQYVAKDRSGSLERYEDPDLSVVAEKIRAGNLASDIAEANRQREAMTSGGVSAADHEAISDDDTDAAA